MNTGNQLIEAEEVEALQNLLISHSNIKFHSAFITTHGAIWDDLNNILSKKVNSKTKIITTIRNPNQRLRSHLKHDATNGLSISEINRNIEEKN